MKRSLTFLILATSLAVGCHLSATSPSPEIAETFARVKITPPTGVKTSIPLGNGLTIVNLFDDFCTECPTGTRFQTMERLSSLPSRTAKIFVVFSEKQFSPQDVENFKAILSMSDALVQGDIDAMKPHLIRGQLLMVFDSTRTLVWIEKPEMTEQDVLRQVSRLMQTPNN